MVKLIARCLLHFTLCYSLFARWLLLFTAEPYLLLVACYFPLASPYFLLVGHYFCPFLVNFCTLFITFCPLLVTFCSSLVTFCSSLVSFCSLLCTFFHSIILLYEHLRYLDILLISKTGDRALEILYYGVLFHKLICAFKHGNTCLKLVMKFKIFDHFLEFLREFWLWKIRKEVFSSQALRYYFLKYKMDYVSSNLC